MAQSRTDYQRRGGGGYRTGFDFKSIRLKSGFFRPFAPWAGAESRSARRLLPAGNGRSLGLPLILDGDWNDSMNRFSVAGRGTSVWLGWFLASALRDFARIAEQRGDAASAENWKNHRDRLRAALETASWDGAYYRRGYFDDGTPLGSV